MAGWPELERQTEMNDSGNEQGNAAAAGQAFQVGDRVRCSYFPDAYDGTVDVVFDDGMVGVTDDIGGSVIVRPKYLTLISRATPAQAAPAQTVADDYDDDIAFSLYCHTSQHDLCHNPDCACSCHDTPRAASEPATPAPAATPPALDIAGISHSVTDALKAIDEAAHLSTDRTEDVVCRALNQIGVALIELLGAVQMMAGNSKP